MSKRSSRRLQRVRSCRSRLGKSMPKWKARHIVKTLRKYKQFR